MQLTGSAVLFSDVGVVHEHNNARHNFADPRVEISSLLISTRGQHVGCEQSAERLVATFVDFL